MSTDWQKVKEKVKAGLNTSYACDSFLDCAVRQEMRDQSQGNNQGNQGNQGQNNQGANNTGQPNGNDKKLPVFGEKGTQTTSTTVGKGKGWRVDVENPNPGQRPRQVHYQSGDTKYLYNHQTKTFTGASRSENKRLLTIGAS